MNLIIKRAILAGVGCLIVITGCRQSVKPSVKVNNPGIPVTVSPGHNGRMMSYIELSATSAFLFKSSIKSPATGYINDILVNQGDAVVNNQPLFTVRTKEAAAIGNDSLNKLNFSGIVNVKSSTTGIITSVDHPNGDFVAEGDQVCHVAITESFVFILDVPFELSGYIRLGSSCEIVLPDDRSLKGFIKASFPSMTVNSQTERFIVTLSQNKSLPENLTAKIRIVKESVKSAFSLPKSCILSDETMQNFWTMKLINDSIAVKVPVSTGITEDNYVQITRPDFKTSDLFLSSGNFGLGDTVYVKVLNNTGNE